MPILMRDDDVPFVIQPYRETVTLKKKSLMAQEIKYLAEGQGQFVKLYAKGAERVEAVFSREPGYLLGESIWHYFHEPDDLIYCEEQADSDRVLLVVVRNRSVYLDTLVPSQALRSELLPLLTDKHHYMIYVYGRVPMTDRLGTGDEKQLIFPKEYMGGFTKVNVPAFTDLVPAEEYKLLPLKLALRSPLVKTSPVGFLVGSSLVASAMLAWWFFQPAMQDHSVASNKTVDANPYAAYQAATTTPDPHKQLLELAKTLDTTFDLPGWRVLHVNFDGKVYRFSLAVDGGNYNELSQWARRNHFQYLIKPDGVELALSSGLPERKAAKTLMHTEEILALLMDQLNQLLDTDAVKFENNYARGRATEALVSIRFDGISPEMLSMIGEEFDDLPVKLRSITADMENGLMKGAIELSVWGA